MNYWTDTDTFDEMCEKVGNKFDVINILAKRGRQLSKQIDYPIRDSSALKWAYLGIKPERPHRVRPHLDRILDDVLGHVNEETIITSVTSSIKQSCEDDNLRYIYRRYR